ncbi:hypothetical protein [Mycobacteroides chelonae]|uniref:hypothetical protein n=1 Tax=Mycobacteroides chelonae TaxID=1774 RepID=UPI0018B0CC7C|nr:hypothetical protein [Mycobacteroides chelonae]MBF9519554.1 hypothetical protein [Mycobacteroides chelonae]
MSSSTSDGIERAIDFSYDACWFACPKCSDRVLMTFEDRDRGESRTCRSGHDVSARTEHPALTEPSDIATNPAEIERLVWYHTTTRMDWPPTDESSSAIATHLGTFESAIENMFRRMQNEGDADSQFYLHRVRVACPPAEVSPLGGELSDLGGNVKLRVLDDAGYRVMRYVNVFEHPGSVSLVVVPSVITHVQALAVPFSLNVEESAVSREIFARHVAERDEVEGRRPSTEGISRLEYLKPRNPGTAPIVRAARACDRELWAAEDRYKQAMTEVHMPGVGYRTREKVLDARKYCREEPAGAHEKFRLLAELVQNPARTLAAVQAQPVREVGAKTR